MTQTEPLKLHVISQKLDSSRPLDLRIIDLWEHYMVAGLRDHFAGRSASGARYFDSAFLLEELMLVSYPLAMKMRTTREVIEKRVDSLAKLGADPSRFGIDAESVLIGNWRDA